MADVLELRQRRAFRQAALEELRAAYIALVKGGVKTYMIDDRQLTKFDLPVLKKQIGELEEEIDALDALIDGQRPRRAFAVVPRDW